MRTLFATLAVASLLSNPARAADAPAAPALHAIILVDVIPDRVVPGNEAKSMALLHALVASSLKEPGNLGFLVLQDVGRPNHLTLDETWTTQAAYEVHEGGSASKAFRTGIQPMLGAPLDERLSLELK